MSNPKKKARKDKDQPKPQVVKITLPSDRQNWDRDLPIEHGKFVYIVVVWSRAENGLKYADSVIFGADKGFPGGGTFCTSCDPVYVRMIQMLDLNCGSSSPCG